MRLLTAIAKDALQLIHLIMGFLLALCFEFVLRIVAPVVGWFSEPAEHWIYAQIDRAIDNINDDFDRMDEDQ